MPFGSFMVDSTRLQ